MDLVKIGFIIHADGLEKANKEVDALLAKADRLKNLGAGKGSSAGSNSGSAGGGSSASTKTTEKMIKQQELLAHFLPLMDKQTAALAAKFKALSDSTADLNKYLTLVGQNKAFLKQQEAAERLIAAQKKLQEQAEKDRQKALSKEQQDYQKRMDKAKASVQSANEAEEKARQKRLSAEQQYYQKQMEMARATAAGKTTAEEKARQKKLADEQKYYQQQMDAAKKEHAATVARQQKLVDDAEKARQQNFKAAQDYYQKQMALAQAEQTAKNKQAQKLLENEEKARQKRLSAEQKHYQQQMDNIQRIKDAEKAKLAQQQKAIDLVRATTRYQAQGLNTTNAGKVAKLELSGADVNTVNRYRQALLDAQAATTALGNAAQGAGRQQGFFNTQIGGIVKYAVLSAVIYGVMSAVVNLGVALVKTADEYTSIQNRMRLYISDATELAQVNDKLAQYAMNNNVGLRETSTLFARLAPAMQKIGANTAAVTTVVDAFGKSMRIGGATATEAASATLQFSQAMASGKLAGDEFRSISEASPRFLKAIADGSGIAASKLKEMSSAGMLTTEVISKALIKEYANLSAENEKLGFTLEQGANAIKTSFTVMIGEFNEGAGITQFFGAQMMNLASGMMNAADGAKTFGVSVKQWFSDNKGIIEGVGKAVEVTAYLIGGKLFASYVVAAVGAMQAAKANVALVASQLGVSRSAAAATIMTQRLGAAALQAGTMISTAGTMMKTAFAFLGGWVGLIATVVAATTAYLFFNKANAATAESFRKEGESLQGTIDKYKELGKVKQEAILDSEKANLQELTKAYDDNKSKLIANILNISRHNDMTQEQSKSISALAMSYKAGEISVEQLMQAVAKAGYVSEESKVQARGFATAVLEAGEKAGLSKGLIAAMRKEVTSTGEKAGFAKVGVNAFTKSLEDQAKKLHEVTRLAKAYGLEITSATKLQAQLESEFGAKESSLAQRKKKYQAGFDTAVASGDTAGMAGYQKALNAAQSEGTIILKGKAAATDQYVKALKTVEAETQAQTDYTKAQNKADKDADKAANKKRKDKDKYLNQAKELQVYINLLTQAEDVEVARIASEKEYQNAFGANLEQAKELKELKRQSDQVEARAEYMKSLSEEAEAQGRLVELMKLGLNIEEAKSLVEAKFTNNAKGKIAAELQLTNAAYEQHYALASQIADQEAINALLVQGYSLEAATFRIRSAKVRGLSGKQTDLDDLDAAYDKQLKQADAYAAVQETLIKINDLNREGALLAKALSEGYTRSNLAAAALAGSTKGMSLHLATSLLIKQDSVAMDTERANNAVQMLSYLNGESEVLRDIKDTYTTITPEQAKALEIERKHLKLLDDFAAKKEEQKKTPLGDFSTVNFDAFGDFGNPFKDALDGANNYISSLNSIAENLKVVQEVKRQYEAEAELAGLDNNIAKQKELLNLAAKQGDLEKDYVKEKEKANDIAFGQGLKLAKSLFKEESKGYKVISNFEQAYQASKMAFALWEKKDQIKTLALTLGGYVKSTAAFIMGATAKVASQAAVNVATGTEAVLNQGSGDPYTAFARMAAMAAIVAGLGIAVGGVAGGSSSGTFEPTNEGKGTVFGDATAQSESIKNAMEILADNSDVTLPLTSAMLKSLQNIENSIGGLASLVVRGGVGTSLASGVTEGFASDKYGSYLEKAGNTGFAGIGDFLGLNKAIGSFLGGLFGSKTTIKGQGLAAGAQSLSGILDHGFGLNEYVDIETKKKKFGITTSTKNSTQYTKASQELSDQFTLVFKNLNDSILNAAPLLDQNLSEVTTKLNDFVVNIGRINLQGLSGEQIQEQLTAILGAEADKMAQAALGGLEGFQKVGEGYFETVMRVASSIELSKVYTDRLNVSAIKYNDVINKQGDVATEIIRQSVLLSEGNKNIKDGFYDLVNSFNGTASEITDFVLTLRDLQDAIFATGKNGDYLTSAMFAGAGSLERLQSGLEAYFEMLSPAEQVAELTRRLTKEFAIFGKELPSDVKAFRDLVAGIDISTEAGQKLYGQIIALAPEFSDLQDAMADANSDLNALVQSLRDLAEQARAARGETDQPSNLAYVRNEFESQSMLALQGDKAAAEKLLTLGKDLMTLSKQYSVTGNDYAKDLAWVQAMATLVADLQEKSLGSSANGSTTDPVATTLPSLALPNGTTGASQVIATTNSSSDAKLDALREDMITAITAVAKYTQDTARRLERWDYGDRMNVHVEQDATDVPLQVHNV
jgi:tape measure domain-containing protein